MLKNSSSDTPTNLTDSEIFNPILNTNATAFTPSMPEPSKAIDLEN